MEMRKYIEMGEKAAGNQQQLADYLGQKQTNISRIKSGKAGLPNPICVKLADLIGEPRLEVIAASDLVTEKNAERRKIMESCFSKAAVIVLLVGVTMIVTPSPAHAAPLLDSGVAGDPTLYIMLNRKRRRMTMANKFKTMARRILTAFGRIQAGFRQTYLTGC